ncbi:MAG: hypothetical protein ACTS73_08460 [Arsenophonus sp. NEOnobi-MAG3]
MSTGIHSIVHNGYSLEGTIQTGIGEVKIKVPKVRGRSQRQRNMLQELVATALYEA